MNFKIRNHISNLSKDKRFSEIFKGSIFAFASKVFATVLALGTSIIVARVYGAEMLGVLALINTFLSLVTIFTVLGTGTSILRFIPEHVAKYSTASAFRIYRQILRLVGAVSLITGLLFFAGSDIIAEEVFGKPHLAFYFGLAAVFVIFKALVELNTQAVRGLLLMRIYAIMLCLPQATMFILLMFAILFWDHQYAPIYVQLVALSVVAVAGILIMNRAFRRRISTDDPVQLVSTKEVLKISMPMLLTSSMLFFTAQAGTLLLGVFGTESDVGYYSVAVKLATITVFILQAINSVAAPKLSQFYHTGQTDELFYVAQKTTRLVFWTTVPMLLVLVILGKPILILAFGSDFSAAYLAMVLLVIGSTVSSISGPTGHFMNMTGQQNIVGRVIFASAAINIASNLLLIPTFGINGAAFSGMISVSFWNICLGLYIKRIYGRGIWFNPFCMFCKS